MDTDLKRKRREAKASVDSKNGTFRPQSSVIRLLSQHSAQDCLHGRAHMYA